MIRYANLKDAKRIATININGWRTAYKGIVSDEELAILYVEKATINVRERLIAKPHEIIVIEYETEIEGFIGFGTARDEDITKTCAEIYAVYFDVKYYGNGSAITLMNWVFNRLKDAGYHEVILWVFKDNHRARRFYEKMGFTTLTKEKWYKEEALEYRLKRLL